MLPAVEFAQKSDPGRDPEKQVNEDACGYRETRLGHLAVVCDGMGGHAGGREASNLALQTIFEHFDAAPPDARGAEVLRTALELANQRVYALAGSADHHARPGSTVVAVLLHAHGAEVAHVGDSRIYFTHGGQIFQVTKDHSMVQQLVDAGFLSPAQAAVHPNANQITRALGMQADVEVDVRPQPLHFVAGDAFVLCSDGLSDLVEAQEILQIVGASPAAQAAGNLVDLANARGGHDNVTVQVLRARESAAGQPTLITATVAETKPPDYSVEETLPATGVRLTQPLAAAGAPSSDAAPATQREPPLHALTAGSVLSGPVEVPPAPSTRRRPRGLSTTAIAGLVVGAIGIALAIALVYLHLRDRGGASKPAPFPLTTGVLAPSDGGAP